MLCRMMPKKRRQGSVPVYLNVYDLTPINGYAYWLGLGVCHSVVQGFLCKCVLPASLNVTKIRTVGGVGRESCKLGKKTLRSQSSRYKSTKIVSPPCRPVRSASSTSRRQRRRIPTSSSLTVAVPASAVEL